MNQITEYLISAIVFALLGAWLFFIFRWWFQHLTALAARYDISQRRKIAARRYLVVVVLIAVPTLTALLSIINRTSVSLHFILIGFALALTPAMTWWCPRMASLKSLGYGRQSLNQP
jgi:fatty acid desaturase